MAKNYIDTGHKGDEDGFTKVLADSDCKKCAGKGTLGVRYPVHINKSLTLRNNPCYCGSGKKFKKCCYLRITETKGELVACGCIITTEHDVSHITK